MSPSSSPEAAARPRWAAAPNVGARDYEAAPEEPSGPRVPLRRRTRTWRRLRKKVRRALRRRLPIVVPVVGGLVLVALWCLVAVDAASAELGRAKDALIDVRSSLGRADAEAATEALDRADAHLAAAKRSVGRSPLAVLKPVPLLGSPAAAVSSIDEAAASVIDAGHVLTAAVHRFPTSGGVGVDGTDLAPFRQAALDSYDALDAARLRFEDALAVLEGPSGAALPMISSPAKELAGELTSATDQLDGAERGLALLADLAAPTTDARILVLSQDTMELRATGGFIGSFGVIHFDHGTVSLERYDSFDVLPPPDPPMEPPAQLAIALPRWWGLSNVNWWPHFPTSAETAREMFRRQGGGEVDGVLALTEHTLARLVGVLGPIHVPGYEEPVVEEGFADRVLYEVELKRPHDTPKKRFLIDLSEIVFDSVFSLEADQVAPVIDAFDESIAAGDLQVWFASSDRQRMVAGSVVDGALPETDGDFLMLVDTNMTASKANRDLVRDATYTVDRGEDGDLRARLAVRYRNEGAESSVNPYYNGHLRVYVPDGIELLGDSPPTDLGLDGPYRVLGRVVVVPPGEERTVELEYRLPATVADGGYELTWLRQAGTPADSLRAVVGGTSVDATKTQRELHVDDGLSRNALRDWLHDRWVLQRLGF